LVFIVSIILISAIRQKLDGKSRRHLGRGNENIGAFISDEPIQGFEHNELLDSSTSKVAIEKITDKLLKTMTNQESFILGILSSGENTITSSLLQNNIDLEKCLKKFKSKLSDKKTKKNTENNINYESSRSHITNIFIV
jgi:hypothetical protein